MATLDTSTIPQVDVVKAIAAGQGFFATTKLLATATNANLTMAACLFNNSQAKNMLVYSARIIMQDASQVAADAATLVTANPAYANAITPVNLSAGSSVSSLATVTSAANGATASVTVTGTVLDNVAYTAATPYEYLGLPIAVLLPAGAANGLTISGSVVTAAHTWIVTFKWIEI